MPLGWLALAGRAALAAALARASACSRAHMVEHEVVMAVAAPLIALARPIGAHSCGRCPPRARRTLGPRRARRRARRLALRDPPLPATVSTAPSSGSGTCPSLFDAAVASTPVHRLQHLSLPGQRARLLVGAGPALRARRGGAAPVRHRDPYRPARRADRAGAARALPAADRGLRRDWGLTPLEDQQLAGLIMWIPAGTVYAGAALAFAALWIRHSGGAGGPAMRSGRLRPWLAAVAALRPPGRAALSPAHGRAGGHSERPKARASRKPATRPRSASCSPASLVIAAAARRLVRLPGLVRRRGERGVSPAPSPAATRPARRRLSPATAAPAATPSPASPAPTARSAPPLAGLRKRVFIGGVLRNTPDNLIAWIVDPQRTRRTPPCRPPASRTARPATWRRICTRTEGQRSSDASGEWRGGSDFIYRRWPADPLRAAPPCSSPCPPSRSRACGHPASPPVVSESHHVLLRPVPIPAWVMFGHEPDAALVLSAGEPCLLFRPRPAGCAPNGTQRSGRAPAPGICPRFQASPRAGSGLIGLRSKYSAFQNPMAGGS